MDFTSSDKMNYRGAPFIITPTFDSWTSEVEPLPEILENTWQSSPSLKYHDTLVDIVIDTRITGSGLFRGSVAYDKDDS